MPQIIKVKRGTGTPVSLQLAELGFDKLNKKLFIGTEEGVFDLSGESYAKKTFVDSAVAAEAALRTTGDSNLSTSLNNEISRATAAEGVIAANLATEISDRAAAVSAEASARSAADTTLQSNINTEKGRIDAILSAADADKDSFAEIVSLINSVDTTNDSAFAGYVTSNNAALASETSARQSADTALGIRIDGVETSATALTSRVSAAEQDIVDLGTDIAAETSARQSAISSEQTARQSADTTLQGNIDSEASTRSTADTSLSNRITALENASADSRLDEVEADVADHESRISAMESVIDGGSY
jgi:hypothetical protein